MPEEPKEGGLEMEPTMGQAQNQYKLLLNVIPRGGKLERRPALEGVRLGFGYPGRDAASTYGFQYNAAGTTGTAADHTTEQVATSIRVKLGAGSGSDTPIPANGSSFTLSFSPGGVAMEIKVAFSSGSGPSDAAFQANGTNKVILDIYTGDSDTNDCLEIAVQIRDALTIITVPHGHVSSGAANGVNLFGWTVAVGGSAGAREVNLTANLAVASDFEMAYAEDSDSNNTILITTQTQAQSKAQHTGKWWVKPSMSPLDHEKELYLISNQGAEPFTTSTIQAVDRTPKYERQDIVEGIDVEIVNGKLICIYGARQRWLQSGGADSYTGATISTGASMKDVRLRVSVHSLSDPGIGRLLVSQTESANRRISTLGINNSHAYNAVRYWEKRISRIGSGFMLTGYGVGGSRWKTGYGWDTMVEQEFATDLAGVVTKTSEDVDDPEGLLLFNGGKLRWFRVDDPVYNMDRIDETNSVYTKKRPRNAFMFLDSEGQPVWYGFRRGDPMELQAGIDSANVLINSENDQLSDDGTKLFVDSGTLWFAETMNPHSLPMQGFYTAIAGSRSSEIVGLARFSSGTACFTRDTIEFAQGYFSGYKGQIKLIHTGIGADARWGVKEIAKGVAFLNKDGVHHLSQEQGGSQVGRVAAFDPLFGDGVDFERTPYSDLVVGDSGTETVPNHPNANTDIPSIYAQGLDAANVMRSIPFGHYRVDKTRIDRAVAGVWEDLYLCAVSRDIDDSGDENRLVLCWNYKENTASVWLLPKFMGIRGFAYDGSISAPYVMTRFGLAKFGSKKDPDIPFFKVYAGESPASTYNLTVGGSNHEWYTRTYSIFTTNDNAGIYDLDPEMNVPTGYPVVTQWDTHWPPVIVAGQTNFISGGGEAFVIPKIMITHGKNRYGWSRVVGKDQGDYPHYKYDDDVDMRIQVWGNQTDIEAGTLGENYGNDMSTDQSVYDMKSLTMSDVGMLGSLYKGNSEKEFRAVRVDPVRIDGGSKTVDHTHGHVKYGSTVVSYTDYANNQMPSRRTRGPILRTSAGRSGVVSTKQQVQFYTLDSGDIKSVSFEIKIVVKPGGRG